MSGTAAGPVRTSTLRANSPKSHVEKVQFDPHTEPVSSEALLVTVRAQPVPGLQDHTHPNPEQLLRLHPEDEPESLAERLVEEVDTPGSEREVAELGSEIALETTDLGHLLRHVGSVEVHWPPGDWVSTGSTTGGLGFDGLNQ